MKKLPLFLNTPARVVIAVGLIVLVGEFSVMLLIEGVFNTIVIGKVPNIFWKFIDPLILIAFVSPALYILIFRPMRNQQAELERQLGELHRNERLTALIEAIPDAVFLKNGEGRWLVTNEPARQLFQLHNLPWQGKTEMELADLHPAFRTVHEGCLASDENAWQAGRLLVGEEILAGEDGRYAIIETRKVPMFNEDGQRKVLAIIGRDVTESKTAGARIERLTKIYKALSEVNQAIVRMDDESALFPLVCRTAVDFGGVGMGWIGQLNESNGLIEPVVSYGCGAEYLNGIVISSKQDVPEGRNSVGIAFRENRSVVVNDFPMSEMAKPWHESVLRFGWGSAGFFPIPRAGKPFAVFSVYHSDPDAFDAEMVGLLDEMSRDISFALDSFDRENERKQAQETLLGSERRFRAYFERSMVGMSVTSPEKGWLEINDALCAMLGYSREELMRLTWIELTHPDDREENLKQYGRIISGEIDGYMIENRFVRKNGKVVHVRRMPQAVRKVDGSLDYIVALVQDITERKQAELELRIAATAFETHEAILITDRDERILRVNRAFTRLTGYSEEEAIGRTPAILNSGRQDAEFYRNLKETIRRDQYWQGEIWNRRKDGVVFPAWLAITAVTDMDDQVTHYVGVFSDNTLRKEAEEQIHQLAFYDPLTMLPNRRLLLDRLQQALAISARNSRHGALLFLDLDHFKVINDTQGHALGDQLLIEVAHRLQTGVREGDSVARLGGDEFVVVLEDLSSETDEAASQTELVAEKIRSELGQPYILKDYECLSTVSIGISLFFEHRESAEDLLQHADVAMYQAKTAGRNAIRFFDPHMQTALDMRVALEADLRHALEKQQFSLYYQIQVDSLRRPLGAEVLLRWEHPERGLVLPEHFIPAAEETGLIVPIGLWVLRTACAILYEWQNDALTRGLTLAVNVSAKQFRQADFVAQVQRVLLESGAKPSHLKLELTESTVLTNVEDTIGKMSELKMIGVGFSMDDFGTGYSSLQYLKRLPLDQIKIDQTFVRDIATDPNDAAIVQTIIAMTEALGLDVIAEGVETEAQREFLDLHGCHVFQGYLFSEPVPIEQFEALLSSC